MKTKQMTLTLMFFVCFALFFTGCRSLKVEVNVPKPDTTPPPTAEPIKVEIINLPSPDKTPASTHTNPPASSHTETTQITVSVDPRSTPLTGDIVKNIQNSGLNLKELDYSLSKSFAMTIVERKDTPRKLEISERTLKRPQEQSITTKRRVFTPDQKGTMSEASSETFVVVFKADEDDIPLTFKRNSQGRYDLVSAMIDTERRTDFAIEDDPPQLCILSELNEHLETLAILNSKQTVSQSWQSYEKPSYQKIPAGGSPRQSEQSTRQFSPSRRIDGTQGLTKEDIIKYVERQNPNVVSATLSDLIRIYEEEAKIEGINFDIAIAQMLHATNYLRNRMTTRNYAGLSTDGVPWNWDGTFPVMRTGVKAHIHHLKGYVSTDRPVGCVDPRYEILAEKGFWGQVKTFDELFKAWSQNPAYGNEINRILNSLYESSGNY